MNQTTLRLLQIEHEFQSCFSEVIKSFAEAGHSMTDTAEILEIGRRSFYAIVKAMNWRDWFIDGNQSVRRQYQKELYTHTPKRRAAQARAVQARRDKYSFTLQGFSDTATGHAHRLGITPRALRYRLEKSLPLTVEPEHKRLREPEKEPAC